MPIQVFDSLSQLLRVDGTKFNAARTSIRPTDHGTLGHYHISATTGTLAAALAAGAQLWSLRWADATRFAVIMKLKAWVMPLTPFTAATLTDHTSLDAFVARAYSTSPTGGTALTPTGNNAKTRTDMATSLVTDLRIATTAGLTAGTATLDAFPFAQSLRKGNRVNPAAATEEVIMPTNAELVYDLNVDNGQHPIVLTTNEGIIIRNRTVWPAAGTALVTVQCHWAEVTAY